MLWQVAQKIKRYVQLADGLQPLLDTLAQQHAELQADQEAARACKELQLLLDLLQSCQASIQKLCQMLPSLWSACMPIQSCSVPFQLPEQPGPRGAQVVYAMHTSLANAGQDDCASRSCGHESAVHSHDTHRSQTCHASAEMVALQYYNKAFSNCCATCRS